MFAVVASPMFLAAALTCARGVYQRNLLYGRETLSGSILRGKAKQYSDLYARSARNLMARINAAGIPCRERRGRYGRRVLVIGPESLIPTGSY